MLHLSGTNQHNSSSVAAGYRTFYHVLTTKLSQTQQVSFLSESNISRYLKYWQKTSAVPHFSKVPRSHTPLLLWKPQDRLARRSLNGKGFQVVNPYCWWFRNPIPGDMVVYLINCRVYISQVVSWISAINSIKEFPPSIFNSVGNPNARHGDGGKRDGKPQRTYNKEEPQFHELHSFIGSKHQTNSWHWKSASNDWFTNL